ncbi:MAG: recombination protein RecR [Candidatus Aminicenantes bacterium]|nr:recombination protein RecR [Candidatus Aminicenantes bacterium]
MAELSYPIKKLIEELKKIPTIGRKSAQRICFFLLKKEKKVAMELARAIVDAREKTFLCSICFNITTQDPCEICINKKRDHSKICVIEEPFNIISIEKTNLYHGLYHVLHGNLSPIKGIGPEELKISGLKKRLDSGPVDEIILATSPTTEGNATAHYITEMLRGYGIQITRIAMGLPIGADIDYVDSVTIARAIESRTKI